MSAIDEESGEGTVFDFNNAALRARVEELEDACRDRAPICKGCTVFAAAERKDLTDRAALAEAREKKLRNAHEHIMGSCEGRCVLISKAALAEAELAEERKRHASDFRCGKCGREWHALSGDEECPFCRSLRAEARVEKLERVREAAANYVRVADSNNPGYAVYRAAVDALDAALAECGEVI